jgi:hypothetical protein
MRREYLNFLIVSNLKLAEVRDSQMYVSLTYILKLTNKLVLLSWSFTEAVD